MLANLTVYGTTEAITAESELVTTYFIYLNWAHYYLYVSQYFITAVSNNGGNFMKKKRNAFTLIEMVVVLAIIALLILLVAPNLGAQKQRAEKKTDQALVTTLQTQVELASDEIGHEIKS